MTKVIIDVNEDVKSRLGFELFPAYDNFALGYLNDVRFEEAESKEDAKWEFAGFNVPRLVFEFVQHKDAFNDKERFYVKSELPVTTLLSDGTARKEVDVVNDYRELWRRVKHIWDCYDKYAVTKLDVKPEFDIDLETGERLEEFTNFFKNFVKAFNTYGEGGQPIYANYGGKTNNKLVVMKLIASGTKNSYLSLPKYVGKGFIETAVLESGKLKTTLKFGANESPVVGSVNVKPTTNAMSDAVSDDVMKLIRGE
jgi:hypothetical protein